MVSKLKFLGVAEATWARVAAKVATLAKAVANTATKFTAARAETSATAAILARFATAKAVAIKSAKLATMAVLATFATATLTGCDEAKSLAASVSIEEPLVEIAYSDRGTPYLRIQSQDNETIIEDIIINRGNCEKHEYRIKDSIFYYFATQYEHCRQEGDLCVPIYPLKLPYGKTHRIDTSCSANNIIEVELVVNGGGRLTYKFK